MKPDLWKSPIVFLLFVLVVLGIFFAISSKRAPHIPRDDAHRPAAAETDCRPCHAPGKEAPLDKDHPPKEQCFKCHHPARERT